MWTDRGSHRWLPACAVRSLRSNGFPNDGPIDLLLCIADHFEPGNGGVTIDQATDRVRRWVTGYPELFQRFRDSDGFSPQHTFFYPLEMYQSGEIAQLAKLCRDGFGEVEVHLHHDNDNSENLRRTLQDYCRRLREEHGLLSHDQRSGAIRYGFVHGNWALDNSRPDGRRCGVNNELDVLRETGCYADFTLPSYPSPTQTRKINSIYYAVDDPVRPKSHDWGQDAGCGCQPDNSLMLIQGPLMLNWHSRKFGLLPRIENGNIQANQAPAAHRLDVWLKARVQVKTRRDWFFVKLHTHGAVEANQKVLLGDEMVKFHEELARRNQANPNFRYHYVTARELYNLARAAEAGWTGSVKDARNFELIPNG
jgi:hypothetical protein